MLLQEQIKQLAHKGKSKNTFALLVAEQRCFTFEEQSVFTSSLLFIFILISFLNFI